LRFLGAFFVFVLFKQEGYLLNKVDNHEHSDKAQNQVEVAAEMNVVVEHGVHHIPVGAYVFTWVFVLED
jgi:hypothetical protein